MNFDVLNPNATVSIALQGLSVCCFNQNFDNNRGRWEVAIPRFKDHALTVEIVGLDLQADGGTHVHNTSEVGSIRVADYKSKGAINKRIYIEII